MGDISLHNSLSNIPLQDVLADGTRVYTHPRPRRERSHVLRALCDATFHQ